MFDSDTYAAHGTFVIHRVTRHGFSIGPLLLLMTSHLHIPYLSLISRTTPKHESENTAHTKGGGPNNCACFDDHEIPTGKLPAKPIPVRFRACLVSYVVSGQQQIIRCGHP